jgi:uncharacterized protein YjiS (DUF1127 family)
MFARLWKWWLELRGARQTRNDLHRLNDRMLKDIGLRRGQIDSLFP